MMATEKFIENLNYSKESIAYTMFIIYIIKMLWYSEWKNKPQNENSIKNELTSVRNSIFYEEAEKKRKRRIKFIKKKLIERKKKEAFPRKSGKYNELFQDFGKESGVHNIPTGAR